MKTRWIFTKEGKPAFYQDEEHIYSPDGVYSYWVTDAWWYRVPNGEASFYIDKDWIYTPNGKPAYYYGDK